MRCGERVGAKEIDIDREGRTTCQINVKRDELRDFPQKGESCVICDVIITLSEELCSVTSEPLLQSL